MFDIFDEPALGHVAYQAVSGRLAIWPMWVSYDGTHLLTSSPAGAKKVPALRKPGAVVAVSIVSTTSPWRWLSMTGHVVDVRPDVGLAYIDAQSRRFTGGDYRDHEHPREVFVIELDRVSHSAGRR
jgi:hypothetical protein